MAGAAPHPELQIRLEELDEELNEGEITQKGYIKRRTLLLSQYGLPEGFQALAASPEPRLGASPEPRTSGGGSSRFVRGAEDTSGTSSAAYDALNVNTAYGGGYGAPNATPASPTDTAPRTSARGLRVHNADDTQHPASVESVRAAALAGRSSALVDRPAEGSSPVSGAGDNRGYLSALVDRGTDNSGYSSAVGDRGGYGPPPGPVSRLQVRNADGSFGPSSDDSGTPSYPSSIDLSREHTMTDYAFNPTSAEYGPPQPGDVSPDDESLPRTATMEGYFTDFTGGHQPRQSYGGGPHRYSQSEPFSPTAAIPPPPLANADLPPPSAVHHQLPLEPREVPFAVYDPHNQNLPMSKFDNIAAVLRHRATTLAKKTAYWTLDSKGKEFSYITWDKLGSRAEKVAQIIRDKSNLYRGDRVALVFRNTEIIEFAVAFLGCLIAGVVAVPINELDLDKKAENSETLKRMGETENYRKLNTILTTTQAHLALTTDANLKTFQRIITENKLSWPRGVEWWKTNDFGSFHPKKKEGHPPLVVPDLAYIEFSKAPTGDLRGVVISHRTIMHQMACLSAMIATIPNENDTFKSGLRNTAGGLVRQGRPGEIMLSYLDPRQSIGLILTLLLAIYGGHTVIWIESDAIKAPGLYAHLITKYKATLLVADYPGLKQAAYNYQTDPMTTRQYKKNFEPNFSSVRLCMIDTLTVDPSFHEILADRWLKPLGNARARDVVAPMLCLPEHGGMIITMRDWLGGEERMGCLLNIFEEREHEDKKEETPASLAATLDVNGGYSSLIGSSRQKQHVESGRTEVTEVLLDKESLKTNEVVVVAIGENARKRADEPGTVRVGGFGYPIPDATLAIVDPESSLLCTPGTIGEIWVDSPSISGGFWALQKHTESIFHARPYKFEEGNPTPVVVEPEFLRTGLLGTVIEGKIFVLGLYEDRLRQRVEWVEHGMDVEEHRYFFVQHLIISIMKHVPKIYDASAFDTHVNNEHLPIILLESAAASTAPTTSGGPMRPLDTALLDSLSERCMEVLYQEHHLRVFCVMITAPGTLPRQVKNGREEIGNMLCRRDFEAGNMTCVHIKFGVERSVMNLPLGVDPAGGIWSPTATAIRHESLPDQDKQYSGADYREVVIDDRTSTPLNNFSSIVDLFQWRVARQAEELAYCTIDGRGRESKGVTWSKFDHKVAAVAVYLKNKCKVVPGDHVVLMYTHSEEFIYAVHACFCIGAVAIPVAPLDQNRLSEDAPAFLHLTSDFRVKCVLVNSDVDHLLKQKVVSQHIKQSATVLRVSVPPTFNTTKPSKQSSGCRELGFTLKPAWVQPGHPVLIWTYWTPDQRRIAVQLGHDTIMGICKVQKETCQMTSSRPVMGCVRSTMGLGFIHTCLMGVFVGAPTYLVSPVDFAQNPFCLFSTLARYKIKDTYATAQMLDHAMNSIPGKGFKLHELKNMMIATDSRPRVDIFQKVRLHFATAGLDRTAINTAYSHVLNPMITTRSYMCIEPIELWLDPRALRRGFVYFADPESDPTALFLQDSGMVPVSTQITIVNPETNCLCLNGEYGEIWVQSEACVHSFYGSRDAFDAERFNGRTMDGDPNATYVRTGDLGFLHCVTRPIGPNGQQVEMQVLFVLGSIGETFDVNGLSYFPMDIERSVERSHRNITPGGCVVFQAGGLIVSVVEVTRKSYLASLVPVIVNVILNEHQLITDIVAFVAQGDFSRSRLGEKQRGKILASWVTRKLRTVAQFSIRDPEGPGAVMSVVPEEAVYIAQGNTSLRDEGSLTAAAVPYAGMQPTLPDVAPSDAVVPSEYPTFATESDLYDASIVPSSPAPGVPPKDRDPESGAAAAQAMSGFEFALPPLQQNLGLTAEDEEAMVSPPAERPSGDQKGYFAQQPLAHDPEQTPLADTSGAPMATAHATPLKEPPVSHEDDDTNPPQAPSAGSKPVITTTGHDGAADTYGPAPSALDAYRRARASQIVAPAPGRTASPALGPGSATSSRPGSRPGTAPNGSSPASVRGKEAVPVQYTAYNPAYKGPASFGDAQDERVKAVGHAEGEDEEDEYEWPEEAIMAMRHRGSE